MNLRDSFSTGIVLPSSRGEVEMLFASGVPSVSFNKRTKLAEITIHPEMAQRPIVGRMMETEKILPLIQKAEEMNRPILIRIEQQRKKNIDVNIPIKELKPNAEAGRLNTVKLCVGVYDYNNNRWLLTSEALTDPNNDTPAITAVIAGAKDLTETVDEGNFFKEEKPFIPLGENFHKQQQLITMYFFVKEQENKHGYELTEDERIDVARKTLNLADMIQKSITKADYVNYKGYEHTRARAMVFNFTEHFYPLTEEAVKNLTSWAKEIFVSANNLIQKSEG